MIVNNAITGNSAASGGGGICCYGGSPLIVNSTITGNSTPSFGGGVYCNFTVPTLTGTIVAFNSSGIYRSGSYTLTLRYNCVYSNKTYNFSGLTNPTGTNGNLSADPRFVRPASPGPDGIWGTADDDYGNLRLLPGSACIDAGNNADVPADVADLNGNGNTTEPLPFDLAGANRFLDDPATADTGAGTAPIVDIGAYEYLCGDVNGNSHVDVVDLLYMADAWGSVAGDTTYNLACDFNGDGGVDIIDLLYMANRWGL